MKFFEVYAYLLSHLEIKVFTSLLSLYENPDQKIAFTMPKRPTSTVNGNDEFYPTRRVRVNTLCYDTDSIAAKVE